MVARGSQLEGLRADLRKEFPFMAPIEEVAGDSDSVRPTVRTELHRAELRPELFGFQRELSKKIVDVVRHRDRGLLALPTGAGKTRTAVAAVLEALALGECGRVAWLAPSVELVDQAWATFETMWRED